MPTPTLSPEEDALLRFGVTQAWAHAKGVHKTQLDKRIQGESADHLHALVERGLLRRAGAAEYLPTIHGQMYMPAFAQANDSLPEVFEFGKRLLNSDNPDKTVQADDLAKAISRSSISALNIPQIRFWFDCSLFGLEPYITVVGASSEGRPLAVYFAPALLSIRTPEELLAKIDADRVAAEERAATKAKPPRERKRKRASRSAEAAPTVPRTVINVSGPVGAIQTGDHSTANVQQNVSADDGKAKSSDRDG